MITINVSGSMYEGKSTIAHEIAALLRAKGLVVDGVYDIDKVDETWLADQEKRFEAMKKKLISVSIVVTQVNRSSR
jgi:adenylylsulfate kinase-like enzyme